MFVCQFRNGLLSSGGKPTIARREAHFHLIIVRGRADNNSEVCFSGELKWFSKFSPARRTRASYWKHILRANALSSIGSLQMQDTCARTRTPRASRSVSGLLNCQPNQKQSTCRMTRVGAE